MFKSFTKRNLKLFILGLIMAAIAYGIGYTIGTTTMLSICIETGERMLDITLSPEAMGKLIQRFPEIRTLI